MTVTYGAKLTMRLQMGETSRVQITKSVLYNSKECGFPPAPAADYFINYLLLFNKPV